MGCNLPYYEDLISTVDGVYTPSTQKIKNNLTYSMWKRFLFERVLSVLQFELPDEWRGSAKDFFEVSILVRGYVGVFNTEKFGLIFQTGSVSGQNVFYQPTNFITTNPNFAQSYDLTIGKKCELLKITKDYAGIWDIVCYFAEKICMFDPAIDMAITNSKTAFAMLAQNKQQAASIKSLFDNINSGNPTVVADTAILSGDKKASDLILLDRKSIKDSYVGEELLRDQKNLLQKFDREIGIPSLPFEKKERLISGELDALSIDSSCRALRWKETFNESAKAVNEMFGTNISCRYRYEKYLSSDAERGDSYVGNTDNSGII